MKKLLIVLRRFFNTDFNEKLKSFYESKFNEFRSVIDMQKVLLIPQEQHLASSKLFILLKKTAFTLLKKYEKS